MVLGGSGGVWEGLGLSWRVLVGLHGFCQVSAGLGISMGLSGSRRIWTGLDRFSWFSASKRVSDLGGPCGLSGFYWFSAGFGISKGLRGSRQVLQCLCSSCLVLVKLGISVGQQQVLTVSVGLVRSLRVLKGSKWVSSDLDILKGLLGPCQTLDGFVRSVHLKGYKQVLAGSSSSWHLNGSLWVSASLGRSLRVLVGLDRSWWVLAFQRVSEGPSGSWRVYAGLGGS